MKKKIVILSSILAFVLAFVFSMNIYAANEETTTTEQNTEVEETTEATEEEEDEASKFIDEIKKLSWEDAKSIIAAFIVVNSTELLIVLGLVIKLLASKHKQAVQSQLYQDAVAKLSAENRALLEEQNENIDNRLATLESKINLKVEELNDEDKKKALETAESVNATLDKLRAKLED